MPRSLKEKVNVLLAKIVNFDFEFGAATSSETVDSDRHLRRFGNLTVLAVFGGVGMWAVWAPIEGAAIGSGVVQVDGNRKSVQHLEGGIVSSISVSNGDYVEAGDILLRLDDTQILAEKNIVEGRYWARQATVDRLVAERDELLTFEFSPSLEKELDVRAKFAMDNETALFKARLADRAGEIEVLRQRVAQLESRVTGSSAVLLAKQDVAESLATEVSDLKELLDDGYVDKQRILQLERALAESLGEIDELKATISAAEVSVVETELQITQLKKRFTSQVINELAAAQDEAFDYQQRLTALSVRLQRTNVVAPVAGLIMKLSPSGPGEVVGAGQELMAIVPDTDKLVVSTKLSPMDRDRLFIGQEAEIRFSVFKDAYSVTGELVTLSADSIVDEITGAQYYEGKVALLAEDIHLLDGNELVPGMPATVLVKTGSRTLLGYLTSPLRRMFENSLIED